MTNMKDIKNTGAIVRTTGLDGPALPGHAVGEK